MRYPERRWTSSCGFLEILRSAWWWLESQVNREKVVEVENERNLGRESRGVREVLRRSESLRVFGSVVALVVGDAFVWMP